MPKVRRKPELHRAIREKDLGLVETRINNGYDVNTRHNGKTPFDEAIIWNSIEIVKYILSRGVNPNMTIDYPPLILCIKNNRLEIAKYLLEMNANPCQPDKNGKTPLSWAISKKNIQMIELLLDYGAAFTVHTALLDAIEMNDLEIVRLLLQKGASAHFTNTDGFSPLLKATCSNKQNLEIVIELISHGADVNCSTQKGTPLINALDRCNFELVTRLIKCRADVNKADQNGNYPIITAIDRRNSGIFELLVENGAKLDVKDENEDTPFIKAVRLMNLQIVKYLVDRGIDQNEKDIDGHTALAIALSNFDFRTFNFLIESGADSSLASEAIEEMANKDGNFAVYVEAMKKKRSFKNANLKGLSSQEDASLPWDLC